MYTSKKLGENHRHEIRRYITETQEYCVIVIKAAQAVPTTLSVSRYKHEGDT